DVTVAGTAAPRPRRRRGLGLDPSRAAARADWTAPDKEERPHGAEGAWYRRQSPPLQPPNGPLGSVGELGLLRGAEPAAVERLRPFVTVAGEAGGHPDTAALPGLEAGPRRPGEGAGHRPRPP